MTRPDPDRMRIVDGLLRATGHRAEGHPPIYAVGATVGAYLLGTAASHLMTGRGLGQHLHDAISAALPAVQPLLADGLYLGAAATVGALALTIARKPLGRLMERLGEALGYDRRSVAIDDGKAYFVRGNRETQLRQVDAAGFEAFKNATRRAGDRLDLVSVADDGSVTHCHYNAGRLNDYHTDGTRVPAVRRLTADDRMEMHWHTGGARQHSETVADVRQFRAAHEPGYLARRLGEPSPETTAPAMG